MTYLPLSSLYNILHKNKLFFGIDTRKIYLSQTNILKEIHSYVETYIDSFSFYYL